MDWFMSEGGVLRYFHADLADLCDDDLLVERNRLRARLAYDPRPDPWLLTRAAAIDADLAARSRRRTR
jgi:hypothetical protein